jgi:hypothetical protein
MKNKTAILLAIIFCISNNFLSAQNRFKSTHRFIYKTTPDELLTQKEWKLAATGFDDNNNTVLDDSENSIEDVYRGNSYFFDEEGRGAVYDNFLSCDGSPSNQFNWRLIDNSKLEVGADQYSILRLTENELVLSPDITSLKVKFIMVYRR